MHERELSYVSDPAKPAAGGRMVNQRRGYASQNDPALTFPDWPGDGKDFIMVYI